MQSPKRVMTQPVNNVLVVGNEGHLGPGSRLLRLRLGETPKQPRQSGRL